MTRLDFEWYFWPPDLSVRSKFYNQVFQKYTSYVPRHQTILLHSNTRKKPSSSLHQTNSDISGADAAVADLRSKNGGAAPAFIVGGEGLCSKTGFLLALEYKPQIGWKFFHSDFAFFFFCSIRDAKAEIFTFSEFGFVLRLLLQVAEDVEFFCFWFVVAKMKIVLALSDFSCSC